MEETLRAKRNRTILNLLRREKISMIFEHLRDFNLTVSKILYGSGLRLMKFMTEFTQNRLVRLMVKIVIHKKNKTA
ncbi:MAG: hypothetical protein JXR70_04990 [Spirochaetales bacterium]|nr:hypothetical protein [Spirochaetales bacterium]